MTDNVTETHQVWLLLAAMLLAAALGGELARRLRQPRVVGEVLAGVVIGNVHLLGSTSFPSTPATSELSLLAELGVALLLFGVGLESSVPEIMRDAGRAGAVALVGVVLPLLLGVGTIWMLAPETTLAHHFFVGATLSATSVGITARVLGDLGVRSGAEGRVILGAAIIDDILALVVLAVVSAYALQGAAPDVLHVAGIVGRATAFLLIVLALGSWLLRKLAAVVGAAQSVTSSGLFALALAFGLAGTSDLVGLAPIVGAFSAGLILEERHARALDRRSSLVQLNAHLRPAIDVLAPFFFVYVGMNVQLGTLTIDTVVVALALTLVAVVGKLAAGFAAPGKDVDGLTVGLGMVPRGEVGLIFASAGAQLIVDGQPVIDAPTYVAVVLMVLFTTVLAPPLLAARLRALGV